VDIPVAPLVLSLVLGGMMEQSFRQAMTISGGNPQVFFGSASTVTLVIMSVPSVLAAFVLSRLEGVRSATAAAAD
jgi:putative tricarboxylic transport membrane protein